MNPYVETQRKVTNPSTTYLEQALISCQQEVEREQGRRMVLIGTREDVFVDPSTGVKTINIYAQFEPLLKLPAQTHPLNPSNLNDSDAPGAPVIVDTPRDQTFHVGVNDMEPVFEGEQTVELPAGSVPTQAPAVLAPYQDPVQVIPPLPVFAPPSPYVEQAIPPGPGKIPEPNSE